MRISTIPFARGQYLLHQSLQIQQLEEDVRRTEREGKEALANGLRDQRTQLTAQADAER